jgi:outer membrane protein, heavy metal efflux system
MEHRLPKRLLRIGGPCLAFLVFALEVTTAGNASAQMRVSASLQTTGNSDTHAPPAESLRSLVQEALAHSPLIMAAQRRWEADTRRPIQESTLPDPQITFQNMAVGNPIPGNDLQTNNFAYVGYGVSQEIPFPTKLGLRAAVAQKDAESEWDAYRAQQRSVVEQVQEIYFNLFFLTSSLRLLRQTYGEFERTAKITEAQYQVGTAQQQDVLKAQLEMTSVLNEEQSTREELAQAQSNLKAVLGREQDAPDIEIGRIQPGAFKLDGPELRRLALRASPMLQQAKALQEKSEQSLKLAHQDYIPDLTVGYMYQKTGSRFPDYYMATLGVRIPLYFWRRQTPAVEQAALEKESAVAQTYATKLSVTSQVQNQWIAIQTTDRVMKIYRDGLVPQAEATLKSAFATYRVGKVDFQTLLSAEIDVLRIKQQYYRAVADHEIAIAKIREIVGDVQ